jgi:hypothetical protein
LSVDPLSPEYPELTPYQFASNSPIWGSDLDGLEFNQETIETDVGTSTFYTQGAGDVAANAGINIQIYGPSSPQVGYGQGLSRYQAARNHLGYAEGAGGGTIMLEYSFDRYLWGCDCNYEVDNPFFIEGALRDFTKDAQIIKDVGDGKIIGGDDLGYYNEHLINYNYLKSYNWGNHLNKNLGLGSPPSDMYNPHAHHIVFKKGRTFLQQMYSEKSRDILVDFGIDPFYGK